MGVLGFTPYEFGLMHPGELFLALAERSKYDDRKQRYMTDIIRMSTLIIFNTQADKKSRVKDIRDFWPMPYDKKEEEQIKLPKGKDGEESYQRLLAALNKLENG